MNEQFAQIGEVELCYETFGDPSDPAMLLIMGLGTQMVAWSEEFCGQLVERGLFVIRYDNRDCGRSSRMKGRPPSLIELVTRRPRQLSYTLGEMADDAAGLLDHLAIKRAHVVGASMGGMIAQLVACRYPARVISLTSIMSTTGGRFVGQPAFKVIPAFLSRASRDKESYVERALKMFRMIGSRGVPFEEDRVRAIAESSWDRGVSIAGTGRQLAAIVSDRNRAPKLKRIDAPTLVIHGTADPLVRPSGGKATAKAIPGAKLLLVDGMGHDLPRAHYPQLIDAIAGHAEAAQKEAAWQTAA